MTFPLKIVGLLKTKVTQDYIQLTTDQTSLQTVGINLTFASGTLTVDWGDGSSTENFVSGVELTHSYGGTGIYNIKISGDLTNITSFIADNNRIITITGMKTGTLTELSIYNNLISGGIDLSDAPINGGLYAYGNSSFTGFTHSLSDVLITNYRVEDCGISGNYDVQSPIAGQLFVNGNSGLTGLTFASSGNGTVTDFRGYSTAITSLNFSNVPLSTRFWLNGVTTCTSLTFASSGNGIITDLRLFGCTGITNLDFSNVPLSTTVWCNTMTSLTSITFASSGNGTVTFMDFSISGSLTTIDFTNVPLAGDVRLDRCALTSVTFAGSANGALTNIDLDQNSLPNIDFSVFSTSDGVDIEQQTNAMTSTEVDNQLINLDGTGWINGTLNIAGTNAARTSASDTAYNNLVANGWTITVN